MSSRKSLLSEGTVRRFMKLATLDNLTETFVDTLDEEELESELDLPAAAADVEDHFGDEEVDELAADDEGAPLDVDPDTVEALVSAIADAIGDVTGTEVTVTGESPGEELPPEDFAPEEEGEVEDVEVADVELPEEEPALEEEQAIVDEEEDPTTESIKIPAGLVEELTRRVAVRLVRDAKK